MNNREAFDFLKSKTSVREASIEFMTRYNLVYNATNCYIFRYNT